MRATYRSSVIRDPVRGGQYRIYGNQRQQSWARARDRELDAFFGVTRSPAKQRARGHLPRVTVSTITARRRSEMWTLGSRRDAGPGVREPRGRQTTTAETSVAPARRAVRADNTPPMSVSSISVAFRPTRTRSMKHYRFAAAVPVRRELYSRRYGRWPRRAS